MSLAKRLSAEGIGSLLLAAAVVGSGVMAERLAGGNAAVALLANTGATMAALATLIALLGPISGAHFNPAVSLIQAIRDALSWRDAGAYVIVQVLGCCFGVILAHAMFDLPWVQSSAHVRAGTSQWLAEAIATFGLLLVVLGHIGSPPRHPSLIRRSLSRVRSRIHSPESDRLTCRGSLPPSSWARWLRSWWRELCLPRIV
jgi:glycerol uptake facilitator-like aquaporin